MLCPTCSFDNPDGMRFCGRCGSSLAQRCDSCGFDNPAGFRFCGRCGAPLDAATVQPQPSDTQRAPTHEQAERRQLTVMFCDLVDSTPLSQQVDPEELRAILQAYQQTCADVVARYDGHVAQYLGDGVLVYFGYPRAHEDGAMRAARAGLEIVGEIARLSRRLATESGVELAVRIGIHTGLVVVGDVGERRDQLALGDTTNLASRLQGIAEPNTVVISQMTARLVAGYFDVETLGTFTLKGFMQPVAVQRVLRESGAGSRVDALDAAGLTPLVGRDGELRRLESLWDEAAAGVGQAATVCGEPGIGKSRIIKIFKDRIASRHTHVLIECRCSPYGQSSALKPVVEGLQNLFGARAASPATGAFDALERQILGYDSRLAPHVPFIAVLLGITPPEDAAVDDLTAQARRRRILDAIVALVVAIASRQPLLMIVEDLHWVDPSTLELIDLLLAREESMAGLLLVTCRPQFRREWDPAVKLTVVELGRLTRAQAEAMVARVAGGRTLPREVLAQIIDKTDGVPLFVEELTKMVIESGLLVEGADGYELTAPLPPLAIPATLQDSLMARLDRLATVKDVAQIGAAIGREFDFELLRIVSRIDEETLRAALARLVEAEILAVTATIQDADGKSSIVTYGFRHALIQDAAYESLLRSRRQQFHQRIALALEESFPETIIERPELLAMHYTSAGIERRALFYWQLAGQSATERSAHAEATSHLRHALELVERMTPNRERDEQELSVQIALGVPLGAMYGFAAPEVAACYSRAYELCRTLGDTPQLFAVARGLTMYYWVAGDLRRSKELGDLCIDLARRFHPDERLVEAHRIAGPTRFWLGDFAAAERELTTSLELYDPVRHSQHAVIYGQDPKVIALSYLACTQWFLGRPDEAQATSRQAITEGARLGHAQTYIPSLVFSGLLHHMLSDAVRTRALSTEIVELAERDMLPMWIGLGHVLLGWSTAELGDPQRGAELIELGQQQWAATGAGLAKPFFTGLVVEAAATVATTGQELEKIAEALEQIDRSGERFWEGELLRLRGALQARLGPQHADEALASLERARAVAVAQGALAIELRIAISRYRVLHALGRAGEGRAELQSVYERFNEGYATKDLLRAQRLLNDAPVGHVTS